MEQHLRGEWSVVVLELIGGDTAVHVVDVQYQPPSVSLGDVLRSPEEIKPIGKGIGVVADVHRLHVHPVLKVNVFVGVLALSEVDASSSVHIVVCHPPLAAILACHHVEGGDNPRSLIGKVLCLAPMLCARLNGIGVGVVEANHVDIVHRLRHMGLQRGGQVPVGLGACLVPLQVFRDEHEDVVLGEPVLSVEPQFIVVAARRCVVPRHLLVPQSEPPEDGVEDCITDLEEHRHIKREDKLYVVLLHQRILPSALLRDGNGYEAVVAARIGMHYIDCRTRPLSHLLLGLYSVKRIENLAMPIMNCVNWVMLI